MFYFFKRRNSGQITVAKKHMIEWRVSWIDVTHETLQQLFFYILSCVGEMLNRDASVSSSIYADGDSCIKMAQLVSHFEFFRRKDVICVGVVASTRPRMEMP